MAPVSIIIPTLNEERFLPELLGSLLRCAACEIDVVINAKLVEITKDSVKLQVGKKEQVLEADAVVWALPRRPDDVLAKAMWAKMPGLVYRIGDCREVKSIGNATEQGAYLARQL